MKNTVYACYIKNEDKRKHSTSGGAFSALAEAILGDKGVVCGACFGADYKVKHDIAYSIPEYEKFRGSKYPQSDMGDVYLLIKKELKANRKVLFTGTPCQNAAIKRYLKEDYDNLYLVDLICMGTASPGIWREYLSKYFSKEHIEEIRFKNKKPGWHNYSMRIKTQKENYIFPGGQNPYFNSYLQGFNIRPSCYHCPFKEKNHKSDLTIGDCWGIDVFMPEIDDDKGTSLVIIQSEKGRKLFDQARKKMEIREISYENAVLYNPYYLKAKEIKEERIHFFMSLEQKGVKDTLDMYSQKKSGFGVCVRKIWRKLCSKTYG